MKTIALLVAILISATSYSQNYSKLKIYTNDIGLQQLAELGLPVDHGIHKKNHFIISDFSEAEIEIIASTGVMFDVLIEDVKQYYADHNGDQTVKNVTCTNSGGSGEFIPTVPINFNTSAASYAGFYKYQEMLDALDDMAAQYPTLISVKAPISTFTTWEGRSIMHVKISDNPATDEAAETKVLYTAIHHAREPMSMSQTIFYMWYLLENYATSDEVKFLVDNTEMYFVPCINPDGYIHNEANDPTGFGMHRKNKRPVGTTNPGTDLNRNYSYGWGTTGISFNENNDTYPGGPNDGTDYSFSEPETQAIKWLNENVNFTPAFNAHSYGNLLLHPIGTTNAEFADHHDYFTDLSGHMCSLNGYAPQKSSGLYPASGDSDDYMYKEGVGVGVKDTVFAMTPEVGSAFWPAQSEVVPTCQAMVFPNLILSHMSHKYMLVTDTDGGSLATLSGNFNHDVQRLGLEDGPVTVSITPLLNVQTVGTPVVYNLNVRETGSGSISYTLNPAIAFGDEVKYILNTEYDLWTKVDTITKTYGALTLLSVSDASNAATNWTGTGDWGTTTSTFVSSPRSFRDSQNNYGNNSNTIYQYNQTIDLINAMNAQITYYAKWEIEADYDYCQFQVSTDGGTTWIGQCGNYTVAGTSANGSVQPDGEPVYEGTKSDWVLEEINLSDYLGQSINVRFLLESDGGVNQDGFYFDDFSVYVVDNGPAVAPVADFSATMTSVCEGTIINFTDFSTNLPTTWAWDFGDLGTSDTQSPTHSYASAGTYTVSLTVTNAEGTNTSTLIDYITVQGSTSSSQDVTICEGEDYVIGWSVYTTSGSYDEPLVGSNGCDSVVTTNLTVIPVPAVTIASSLTDNTLCSYHDATQLTATPAGGNFSGSGMTGDSFNPTGLLVGSHLITYTYSDAGSGCSNSTTLYMVIDGCLEIEEGTLEGVLVYPNPNNGEFTVEGLEIGVLVEVVDEKGRIIYSQSVNENIMSFKLKNVSYGKYFLKSSKGDKQGTIPFIIVKN